MPGAAPPPTPQGHASCPDRDPVFHEILEAAEDIPTLAEIVPEITGHYERIRVLAGELLPHAKGYGLPTVPLRRLAEPFADADRMKLAQQCLGDINAL